MGDFKDSFNSQGLDTETLQYMNEQGLAESVANDQAQEEDIDKQVIVQNPANLLADDDENKPGLDSAWRNAETEIAKGGWTKFVEEKINPIREQAFNGELDPATSVGIVATDIAIGAVVDNVEDIGNLLIDATNGVDEWMQESGLSEQDFIEDDLKLNFADQVWPERGQTSEGILRGVMGYMLPLAGFTKFAKGGTALARGAKAAGLNAGLSAMKQDPEGQNVSNLVQSTPELSNFVNQFFAIDEDDSPLVARAKTAGESVLIDTLTLGAASGVKNSPKLAKSFMSSLSAAKKTFKNSKAAKRIDEMAANMDVTFDESNYAKEVVGDTFQDADGKGFVLNTVTMGEQSDMLKGVEDALNKIPEVAPRLRTTNAETLEAAVTHIKTDGAEGIMTRISAGTFSEMDVAAVNVLEENSLINLTNLAKKAKETGLDIDKAAFRKSIETAKVLRSLTQKTSSDAGAMLKMNQFHMEGTTSVQKRKFMAGIIEREDSSALDEMIDLVVEKGDLPDDALVRFNGEIVEASMGRKIGDTVMEVRMNGMLSGPTTQALSVGAALLRGPIEMSERSAAAFISRNASVADKVLKEEAAIFMKTFLSEGTDQAMAATATIMEHIKVGGKSLKFARLDKARKAVESRTVDVGNFFEAQGIKRKAISSENYGFDPNSLMGKSADAFGTFTRAPGWLLSQGDNVTGMMHYRGQVNSLAFREARAQGFDKAAAMALVDDISKTPYKQMRPKHQEIYKKVAEGAVTRAKDARFLGEVPGYLASVDKAIGGSSITRLLVPFHRVDLNILSQSIDRTPGMAQFTERYRVAIEKGGAAAAEAQAKVAIGGSIGVAAAGLTMGGYLTGDGPRNFDQKKLLKANGWQPNSIKIGDTFHNYEKLGEPFNRILKTAAGLSEIAGYAYGEHANPNLQEDYGDIGASLVALIADAGTPGFLTEGFDDIISAVTDPEGQDFGRLVNNIAVSIAIPQSGLLRSIRKETDSIKRSTEVAEGFNALDKFLNEVRNTIPGFSEDLPPQRNVFGDIQHYPTGFGPDMISPVFTTKDKKDPVIEELIRLGITGPLSHPTARPGENHLVMRMPPNVISVGAAGVSSPIQLSPVEYDRLVVLTSNAEGDLEGAGGRSLKDTIADVLEENADETDQTKRFIVNRIYGQYKKAAKGQLQLEIPELQDKRIQNLEQIEGSIFGE